MDQCLSAYCNNYEYIYVSSNTAFYNGITVEMLGAISILSSLRFH